jgi:hypothetical protein
MTGYKMALMAGALAAMSACGTPPASSVRPGTALAPPSLDAAQAAPADPDVIIDDSAPRLPLAGGYAPADKDDVGANAAEKLAIEEIYRRDPQRSLVESVTRELQVVAGLNYRFVVKMSGANSYRVVVYRPLEGDMRVSEFEKLG